MSLLRLPNELLCHISENLQVEKDIAAFARINVLLYRLTIKQLYRFNAERSKSSALLWAAKNGSLPTANKALTGLPNDHVHQVYARQIVMIAMVLAAGNNQREIVMLLNRYGASPDSYDEARRRNAMEEAAIHGHKDIVKLLLDLGASPSKGLGAHRFAIQHAAMGDHIEVVYLLIEAGEDPDRCSGRPGGGSFSPLQTAAMHNNVEMAKMLLAKGADVNNRSKSGDTPLELAVVRNNVECLKLLLEFGAKVYAGPARRLRHRALEHAQRPGRERCWELLKHEPVHEYTQ